MKIKFILLFFIASITASGALKTKKITITFSEDDFSMTYQENGCLQIETNKLASYPETNEPGLPLFSTDVALSGRGVYISSTPQYSKRLIKTNVQIAQSPIPKKTDGLLQHPAISQNITYNTSAVYPTSNCHYVASSDWENQTVLHFISCPFVYDAEAKELYFIDSIDLDITISEEQSIKKSRTKTFSNTPILKSFVLNADELDDAMPLNQAGSYSTNDRIDYVIITSQALKSSFEPLLQWKKTKGLYSQIITMEEIKSNYSGSDIQLKLKNCLYDLYTNKSLKYVLLGGDDTVVPVRGCYGVAVGEIDETIPTDMYYACFGGDFDWDGNGNGIYGEMNKDNINLAQSIYVTRVPVRLPTHVDAFVSKLLKYEKEPQVNNNMLTCGVKLFDNYIHNTDQSDSEAKGDNLYENYIKPYWSGQRYKFYDTFTDFPGGADYSVNPINLTEQLSKGYTFMDMIAHGGQAFWMLESTTFYDCESSELQRNIHATIITTTACSTNAFDSLYDKGHSQDPCLSESLIRNPLSGIIAYLGCSRYGIELSNGSNGFGASLLHEAKFYENLFSSKLPNKNYGVVVAAAKAALISESSWHPSIRWVQFGLNPIGDPEMPIYIAQPEIFNDVEFAVHDNSAISISTGVPDCRICVMSTDDNGDSYYRNYEDSQSVLLSDLPNRCSVCITKHGYIPKQYTLCLIQDQNLTGDNEYNYDVVTFGSSLTSKVTEGAVVITSGKTTVNGAKIIIAPETRIEKGAELRLNVNN